MGFSALSSANTNQTGRFLSQVSTAVNTAVDTDTGTITAAGNWTGAVEGQAFAVVRGGVVICVRCVKSFTTTTLTYYRLYKEDSTELATDVQVGDTINLYEQPNLVVGTALGSVTGITRTATGSGATLFEYYTIGNNSITVQGYLQLPTKNLLIFGTASPAYSIICSSTGNLAIGSYKTVGAFTVYTSDLLIRGTKTEANNGGNNTSGVLNLKDAACRTDWFGGLVEASASILTDGASSNNTAKTTLYSKNSRFRGLGIAGGSSYQMRIYSSTFLSYGLTLENSIAVLIASGITLGGYAPNQNEIAITYSSSTPSNTWITTTNPALAAGNIVDHAFWARKWGRIVNNSTGTNIIVGGNSITAVTTNAGLHEYRQNVTTSIKNVAGTGVAGRIFSRDTNHGSRLAANVFDTNPSYTSDFTYESALSSGVATFTTDGGILIATAYQNTSGASCSRFQSILWDYRGLDNSNTDRFLFALASYAYEPATTTVVLKGSGGTTIAYTLLPDLGITQATKATVAAYASFTDTAQLYDYAQYWLELSGANMEAAVLGNKLIAYSGSDLIFTTKNLTLDSGAASVLAFATNTITAKAASLASSAKFTGLTFTTGVLSTSLTTGGAYTYTGGTCQTPTTLPTFSAGTLTLGNAASFGFNSDGTLITILTPTVPGTHAITGTHAGTLDLRNASANAITLTIPRGTTYTTANNVGGVITVVFPPTLVTVNAPNIPDGSTVGVYNMTTAATPTEIDRVASTTGGYTGVFNSDDDFADGDVIEFRAIKVTNVTSTQEYSLQTVASGTVDTTLNVTTSLVACSVCDALAIDGSAVTDFEADYTDTQVDVIVAADFYISDLFAWWKYNLTTQDGMRLFWGGMTAIDVGNFQINNDIVSILIDNHTATIVYALDNRRLFRADGVRPVVRPTTGGGDVDVEWREKVLLAETGVSGLTPEESTQLAYITNVKAKTDKLSTSGFYKSPLGVIVPL